jgi:hypothetical protein
MHTHTHKDGWTFISAEKGSVSKKEGRNWLKKREKSGEAAWVSSQCQVHQKQRAST